MSWVFNPFSGTFDWTITGSGISPISTDLTIERPTGEDHTVFTTGGDFTGFGDWQITNQGGQNGTVFMQRAVSDSTGNYVVQDTLDGPTGGTGTHIDWVTTNPSAAVNYRSIFEEHTVVDGSDSQWTIICESYSAGPTGYLVMEGNFGASTANWYWTAANDGVIATASNSRIYGADQSSLGLTDARFLWQKGTTDLIAIGGSGELAVLGGHYLSDHTITVANTPYSVLATDLYIYANATGGGITVNLPAVATSNGRILSIKKTDSSANQVTIDGNASETVDGSATLEIGAQNVCVTLQSTGTEWLII